MQKLFMTMLVTSLLNLNIMTMDSKISDLNMKLVSIFRTKRINYNLETNLIRLIGSSDNFDNLNFNQRYDLISSLNNNPTTDDDVQVKAVYYAGGVDAFNKLKPIQYCHAIQLAQSATSFFANPSTKGFIDQNKEIIFKTEIIQTGKEIINYNLKQEMINIAGSQDAFKNLTRSQNYPQLLQQAKNNIHYNEKMEHWRSMANDLQKISHIPDHLPQDISDSRSGMAGRKG